MEVDVAAQIDEAARSLSSLSVKGASRALWA